MVPEKANIVDLKSSVRVIASDLLPNTAKRPIISTAQVDIPLAPYIY